MSKHGWFSDPSSEEIEEMKEENRLIEDFHLVDIAFAAFEWVKSGRDEDLMFGYTREELEEEVESIGDI